MNFKHITGLQKHIRTSIVLVYSTLLVFAPLIFSAELASASCTPFSSDYGILTSTQTIATDNVYALWVRVKAPSSTNPLRINVLETSDCNITMDSDAINDSTWMWINTNQSNTPIRLSLNSGNITIQATAGENYKLDAILLLEDLTCTPQGSGTNCASSQSSTDTPVVVTTTNTPSTTANNNSNSSNSGANNSTSNQSTDAENETEESQTEAELQSSQTPSLESTSPSDTSAPKSNAGTYIIYAIFGVLAVSAVSILVVLKLRTPNLKTFNKPYDKDKNGPGDIIKPNKP